MTIFVKMFDNLFGRRQIRFSRCLSIAPFYRLKSVNGYCHYSDYVLINATTTIIYSVSHGIHSRLRNVCGACVQVRNLFPGTVYYIVFYYGAPI